MKIVQKCYIEEYKHVFRCPEPSETIKMMDNKELPKFLQDRIGKEFDTIKKYSDDRVIFFDCKGRTDFIQKGAYLIKEKSYLEYYSKELFDELFLIIDEDGSEYDRL